MTDISFTGDIAFTNYFRTSWKNTEFISKDIYDFLNSSDYTVANIEGPITDGEIESERLLNHSTSSKAISCLKKMNANIWNLANNHISDCGNQGIVDTLKYAEINGYKTIGAGKNIYEAEKPIIINKEGGIGIFSVTYTKDCVKCGKGKFGCVVWDDFERIKATIDSIKKTNRWCVLIVHGGEEFSHMPMPYVRKRYIKYLNMGADIIVSHHPHVVQNYEKYGEKIIFYSLGNFIFDTDFQRGRRYTDNGMLIKISFNEDRYSWEYKPIKIERSNNTINICKKPPIFRNITKIHYQLLWPLAAKDYLINNRKKILILEPEYYKDFNWFDWFIFDLRNCRKKQGLLLMLGRYISCFNLWRFSYRSVYKYLK